MDILKHNQSMEALRAIRAEQVQTVQQLVECGSGLRTTNVLLGLSVAVHLLGLFIILLLVI